MKVVVIVPTYNERENIAPLVLALEQQFTRLGHDMHILVVDDASPDGTADVVRGLQPGRSDLHLLSGTKAGLGAAYVRGMRHALNELDADVVMQMDADFSHLPEDLPRLLTNIDHGADFVIGSRYVPGGTVPIAWGIHRRAISLGGNIVARYLAGTYRVRDCTAGFRAIRAALLRNIDLDALRVQGYAFQVALLHAAVSHGAKVVEVPVDFVDRKHGESKLGWRDVAEFVVNAAWLRFQSSRTFLKFAAVGATGVVVNLGVFTWLLHAGLNKYLASPVAIEVSIVSNFLLNNYWTFRERKTRDRNRIKGLKFNAVSLVALGISYGTFVLLSALFPHTAPQVHQLIGILPATAVNYFLNSYWTFRQAGEPGAMRQ
ncbi:MAG TPA: glycosyltransferase family 2 protein [Steroidobacteraceae bacterium]